MAKSFEQFNIVQDLTASMLADGDCILTSFRDWYLQCFIPEVAEKSLGYLITVWVLYFYALNLQVLLNHENSKRGEKTRPKLSHYISKTLDSSYSFRPCLRHQQSKSALR